MNSKEAIEHLLKGERVRNHGFPDGEYVYFNGDILDEDGDSIGWGVFDDFDDGWELYVESILREIQDKVGQLNELGYSYSITKNEAAVSESEPTEPPEIRTHRDIMLALVHGCRIKQKGQAGFYFLTDELLYEYDSLEKAGWDIFNIEADMFEVTK